jgi:hypothetical protein
LIAKKYTRTHCYVAGGLRFGISFGGTISATFLMVGANGIGFFAVLAWNRFRWVAVNGVVLIRGILISGGRSGSMKPSARRANHSENVVYFMVVCSRAGCENKKEHRVMMEQGRG